LKSDDNAAKDTKKAADKVAKDTKNAADKQKATTDKAAKDKKKIADKADKDNKKAADKAAKDTKKAADKVAKDTKKAADKQKATTDKAGKDKNKVADQAAKDEKKAAGKSGEGKSWREQFEGLGLRFSISFDLGLPKMVNPGWEKGNTFTRQLAAMFFLPYTLDGATYNKWGVDETDPKFCDNCPKLCKNSTKDELGELSSETEAAQVYQSYILGEDFDRNADVGRDAEEEEADDYINMDLGETKRGLTALVKKRARECVANSKKPSAKAVPGKQGPVWYSAGRKKGQTPFAAGPIKKKAVSAAACEKQEWMKLIGHAARICGSKHTEQVALDRCTSHVMHYLSGLSVDVSAPSQAAKTAKLTKPLTPPMPRYKNGQTKKMRAKSIILRTLAVAVAKGTAEAPLCLGMLDDCEKKMFDKSIPGIVEVIANKKTGTGSLEIKPTGPVTIGSLLYVIKKKRFAILGPLNNMGMAQGKCGLKIEMSPGSLKVVGRGSLRLGWETKGPCKGIVPCLLSNFDKVLKSLVLELSYERQKNGDFGVEFAIKLPFFTLKKNFMYIHDSSGDGPSIFISIKYMKSMKRWEASLGVRLPIKYCVEGCTSIKDNATARKGFLEGKGFRKKGKRELGELMTLRSGTELAPLGEDDPLVSESGGKPIGFIQPPKGVNPKARFLQFEGELKGTFSLGTFLIEGKISMMGQWYNAFKMQFLHISHAELAVGVELKVMQPVRFQVASVICFGTKKSCSTGKGNKIMGAAFIGVDLTSPAANFLMLMTSAVSYGKFFKILGDTFSPLFHKVASKMPKAIAQSGVYPLKNCTKADQINPSKTECFAMLACSPAQALSITTSYGTIAVAEGFRLQGRMNLLGWNIKVKAILRLKKTRPGMLIDAVMDPLNLLGIIKMCKTLENCKKGPRIYVDFMYSATGAFAILIKGAFKIPALMTHGYTKVIMDHKGFQFKAAAMVFGLAMADYQLSWSWSLKKFKVAAAYRLASSRNLLTKLITGIMGAIRGVFKKAQESSQDTTKMFSKYKTLVAGAINAVKAKCKKWFKSRYYARKCEWHFGIALKGQKPALFAASIFVKKNLKILRFIPMKLLKAVGVGATVLAAAGDKIIELVTSIIAFHEYSWKLELDNGNLDGQVKIIVSILKKKINLGFTVKLNFIAGIVKAIFSKMKYFANFVVNAAKAVAKRLKKIFVWAKRKFMPIVKKVGNSARYAAQRLQAAGRLSGKLVKKISPFRRRRTDGATRRRRSWKEEGLLGDDNAGAAQAEELGKYYAAAGMKPPASVEERDLLGEHAGVSVDVPAGRAEELDVVADAQRWSKSRGYTEGNDDTAQPSWVMGKESLYAMGVRERQEENDHMEHERQREYAAEYAAETGKMSADKALQMLQML